MFAFLSSSVYIRFLSFGEKKIRSGHEIVQCFIDPLINANWVLSVSSKGFIRFMSFYCTKLSIQ